MISLAIASPFVFSFLNRVRGGFFPLKGASAYLAAVALAAFIFAVTLNFWAAGAFLVAYIAGESFGWGKWLSVLPQQYSQADYLASPVYVRDDGKNNGIHWAASKLVKEEEDYFLYALTALAIRGVYWMLPVFVALAATGVIPFWGVFLAFPLGLAFPFPYLLGYRINDRGQDYWGLGEYIYGAMQGLAIGSLLYLGG